ncbi:MAG: hypothetical protein ACODAE_00615 [Gemmatimonadota bacterium]
MYQRDFILRMIEQVGRIMIALRNRIFGREIDRQTLRDELDAVAQRTGLDFALARRVEPETLMMIVAPTGELEPGRCWLLAEMFYLDGLQAKLEGRIDEALDSLDRARRLYEVLRPRPITIQSFPDAEERIREIDGLLEEVG